jgi:DtxR family Mn-dependent transcriptional regulator
MEWYKVHDEAERIEHAVSPDFEGKLLARLGRGGACPHGNLSELESPASRRRRGLLLLSEAEAGKNYAVSGIYERDRHLLEFLEARGIRPGAKLNLIERNYDKTISIRTAARTMVLGRPATDKVWISPLPSRPL